MIILGSSSASRTRIRVEISGIDDIRRKVFRLTLKSPIKIQTALLESVQDVVEPQIVRRVRTGPIDYPIIYKGKLLWGIKTERGEIKSNGQRVSVDTGVPDIWYAYWIEKGGPPRLESLSALRKWIEQKWGMNAAQAAGIAKNMQKRIMKQGTRAQPFIVPAFQSSKARLVTDFIRRLRTVLLNP